MRTDQTRRRFLEVTFALVGTSAGYTVVAQDDESDADPNFQLEGRTSGWEGVDPDVIEDETNPTLTLVQGEEYVLEWRNGDGRPHNFAIENEDGEDLLETDLVSSGSQIVEFTVEEEMSEYYCQPHSSTMRGDIEIVDDPDAEGAIAPGGTDQEEGDDEATEDDQPAPEDAEETVEFSLTEEGWEGQAPDTIEGEVNPTLELEAGTVYEIVFTTEIGRAEHETGHNLLIVDENGREVVHTDFLEEGQEGSVVFTAEGSLARYLDQTQLDVGGDIEVSGGDGEEGGDGGGEEGGDGDGGEDGDGGDERIGVGIDRGTLL